MVTQDEYLAITGSSPSNFKGGKKPVENVSWDDAVSFCQKLTERERTAGRLPSGYEYLLPTEAQWEFAARGGNMGKGYKYSGSDTPDSVGWYYENSGNSQLSESSWKYENLQSNNCQTHAVGTKSPNELGIHDMSGNVKEWCNDWKREYSVDSVVDPAGPTSGSRRVVRGGSWYNIVWCCRVVFRGSDSPDLRDNDLGFRVALASSSR